METQKTQNPPGVFIGAADTVGFHNNLHHKTGILIPAKQRIFLLPIVFFFEKYSCLTPAFSSKIELLNSGGLIQLWRRIYQRMPVTHREEKDTEPRQLSLEQVGGIFVIAAWAYGVCLVVFLIELLSMRIRCLQVLFRYL